MSKAMNIFNIFLRRKIKNLIFTVATSISILYSLFAFFGILFLFFEFPPKISYFTSFPQNGGILNAILGSLILGFLSTSISYPFALITAIYINTYSSKVLRYVLDLLYGIPSIIYATFIFMIMILTKSPQSLFFTIISTSLIIFPIITRSIDEVMKQVPQELKENAYGMGFTTFESTKIILRYIKYGISSALILGFSRGISDVASPLLIAGFSEDAPRSIFDKVATLPVAVILFASHPDLEIRKKGFASAIILFIISSAIAITIRIFEKIERKIKK